MLKGSSSSSKSSGSKSSSSKKVSGVHMSGSYGGSKGSSSSRPSVSTGSSGRLTGSSGSSWTGSTGSGSSGRLSGSGGTGTKSTGSRTSGSSGVRLSGSYGSSSSGFTPIPSGAQKVTSGGGPGGSKGSAGKAPAVSTGVLGAYTTKNGGSSSGGTSVPRYDLPGFQAIKTPDSTGKIKGWNGGKLVNGVIKYPTSASVDPDRAARAQAFVDYSYGCSTSGSKSMGNIYGKPYYDELERLANLPVGAPAWGGSSGGVSAGRPEGTGGGSGGGGSFESSYEAAIRAAQEAAAEALRQQVEQGVSDIYAQRGSLDTQFQKAAQQLYIANMQGRKTLPQQLAAQGLTGGAAESASLSLETTFGNGLSGLLDFYNQAIAQLDRDAAGLRASGNLQQAQNAAEFAKQLAEYAYQTQQRMQDLQAQKELAAYKSDLDYDNWYRQQF